MLFENIALTDLIPDPANARKHSKKNLAAIKASLARFGQQKPIVIDAKNIVVAGNGTLEAAKALKWDSLACVRTTLNNAEAIAYAIADNRTSELAKWDNEVLMESLNSLANMDIDLSSLGFSEIELRKLMPAKDDAMVDNAPESAPSRCKPGDVWLLGEHRVMCGDSTDAAAVTRLLNGRKPVLMVTDPPYGVEYDAEWRIETGVTRGFNDNVSKGKVLNDDRADWSDVWALFGAQVAYVWHASTKTVEVHNSVERAGYEIICMIVWVKQNAPIGRSDYHWRHETCWYAHKKGTPHNWQGSRTENTVWEIAQTFGFNKEKDLDLKTSHSTQKPIQCMERPMLNNSAKGDLVCDPFLGSGTSIIAAERSGRVCYGMELNPKYCDIIIERWQKYTGREAQLHYPGEGSP